MSKQCEHCGQQNADWAFTCGRCNKVLEEFTPLDLDDAFENYMRTLHPTVAGHEPQYKESRRVWFAASAALFYHMAIRVPRISDDDGVKEFERIQTQLEEFKQRVAQHRD